MPDPYFYPLRCVLLTGAGFTKPFGGYLATEMWALILNQPEIQQSDKLRNHLLKNLDYESVADKVMDSGDFTPEDQQAFATALERAYCELDNAIRYTPNERRGQTAMMLRSFLSRFSGMEKERGFIFTLNQDLLVERFYSSDAGLLPIPGGIQHPDWFTQRFRSVDPSNETVLPDDSQTEKHRTRFWLKEGTQNFVYIKLHGSYGWRSHNNTSMMVIGHTKAEAIEKEPLLRWYLELFKSVLGRPQQILVTVGYGFRDEHINNIIADAIGKGLRLHIISPKEPRELRDILDPHAGFVSMGIPRGREIWHGLHSYHCASVLDLVRHNSTDLTAPGKTFFQAVGLA